MRMKKHSLRLFAILFVCVFLLLPGGRDVVFGKGKVTAAVNLKQLERYFEKALKDWNVPGMSVAIVKDGRVVLAKGYGVREHGKPAKVDEKTLFAIASNTKAFTSACLGMLVDEGKVTWDDKVRHHLNYFQLYDRYVTENATLRDLLCHRIGFRTFSGDLLWYDTSYDTVECIKRARHLKPVYPFRSGYGYSNLMYMAAGEVVASASGMSWGDFVKQRIFKPLGMETSTLTIGELKKSDNVATPHYNYDDGRIVTVPYTQSDCSAGAAAINSNAHDMAQWVKMLLNQGKVGDEQLISPEVLETMWTPFNAFTVGAGMKKRYPMINISGYGLGWGVRGYRGIKVVSHGGALDGMISRVQLAPEINLGVVVLTNSLTGLSSAISLQILDAYMGVKEKDWSKEMLELDAQRLKAEQERKAETKEPASLPRFQTNLNDYVGKYTCPMYGDVVIKEENGALALDFVPSPGFNSTLAPLHYDTFTTTLKEFKSFAPKGTGTAQFIRNAAGEVVELKVDIPNHDFHFTELELKKQK